MFLFVDSEASEDGNIRVSARGWWLSFGGVDCD